MENKDFNLESLFAIVRKNSLFFLLLFIVFSAVSVFYVLQIEKSYQSTLVANFPLQNGIETEYVISNMATMKSQELNQLLDLSSTEILLEQISLQQIRHEKESTYGVVKFVSNFPDKDNIIKDKFIDYINGLTHFKSLINLETKKNKDLISSAEEQYKSLSNSESLQLAEPLLLKEKLYQSKIENAFLSAVVEISYHVSDVKYKPSYGMLVILSVLFSFFIAFALVLLKSVFK